MRLTSLAIVNVMAATLMSCGSQTPTAALLPGPPPQPVPAEVASFEGFAQNQNQGQLASAKASAAPVTISAGTVGDGKITVNINGTSTVLDGTVENGKSVFSSADTGTMVKVMETDRESDVVLSLITSGTGDASDASGYDALGAKTSAGELTTLGAAAVATATYSGQSHLMATRYDSANDVTDSDSADGNLTLNVDFAAGTFDGAMDLTSTAPGATNFQVTTVNATISNGDFSSGSLTADVNVQPGAHADFQNGANQLGLDPAVTGKLTGDFFGANAQNVGGTFSFNGSEPDQFSGNPLLPIVVQGGFVGAKN